MRNIILAVTSFFAAILIFSQVALAESDDSDPKHSTSATNEEPNQPANQDKPATEAGVPNAGNNCPACFKRVKGGRLGDNTAAKPSGSSATQEGSTGNKGTDR